MKKNENLNFLLPGLFFAVFVLAFLGIAQAVENGSADNNSPPGFVSPVSDNAFKSPSTGPGLEQVRSDNNFNAPESDNNFNAPSTGPGYIPPSASKYTPPTVGPGFIPPELLKSAMEISVPNQTPPEANESVIPKQIPKNIQVTLNIIYPRPEDAENVNSVALYLKGETTATEQAIAYQPDPVNEPNTGTAFFSNKGSSPGIPAGRIYTVMAYSGFGYMPIGEIDLTNATGDVNITIQATWTNCTGDSQCAFDQICQNSQCTQVKCQCGVANNHACQKYQCCSEADCGGTKSCDATVHECTVKAQCIPVVEKGDPSDKHNIVFVGDGIADYQILSGLAMLIMDYDGTHNGVFSVKPFSENIDKFNVSVVPAPDYKNNPDDTPDKDDYQRFVKGCSWDTVIVLSPKTFRPYAYFPTNGAHGGLVFASLGFIALRGADYAEKMAGRMVLHELGHAIGHLNDEYVEYGLGSHDLEKASNCAPDLATAKHLWGDLVGVGGVNFYTGVPNIPGTIYYKSPIATIPELGLFPDGSDWSDGGCSSDWKNIRPTLGGIMLNSLDLNYDYGPVDERVIASKLGGYK